jgi:uncharacterized protein
MGALGRRELLQAAIATAGGVAASGPLAAMLAQAAGANPPAGKFDQLMPVKDLRDEKVRLHLPKGFSYRSFHDTDGPAVVLNDGTVLPGRHDGMAAFPGPNGNVWLVRNHEVNNAGTPFGPLASAYDTRGQGGTTSVLVTPFGEVIEAFTSLNGTMTNCAGGAMPWGSWLTCEETVNGPDVGPDFTGTPNTSLTQRHGYVFEVPVGGQSDRTPIRSAGRFPHEAAVYSPNEGIVYLTEDNFAFPSGLYRYIPPVNPMAAGKLTDGGRLQMLAVQGMPNAHLEAMQVNGATYPVTWVDIDEPDTTHAAGTDNNTALVYVSAQGLAKGAAGFSRLEGAVYTRGEIYFTSTQGGGAAETGPQLSSGYGRGVGQVWSYDPKSMTLTCRYQSPDKTKLELPDNITARNDRGTVILCEDGPIENYIRGLTRNGVMFDIALNQLTRNTAPFAPRFGEEFAGATFSPDGETLFVNIQASQGVTFAIWGPWGRLGV